MSRASNHQREIGAASPTHHIPPKHLRTTSRAYYTVAHLLQGEDNLDGSRPGPSGVEASAMRDAEWDYVFLQGAYPEGSAVPEAKLAEMRCDGEGFSLCISAAGLL